jgi:hypothetical protein
VTKGRRLSFLMVHLKPPEYKYIPVFETLPVRAGKDIGKIH